MRPVRLAQTLRRGFLVALALSAAGLLPAANATPAPAAQPANQPTTEPPSTTAAEKTTPAPQISPAVVALQPSEDILTFTLDNYNQLVAVLREKDERCLTLETAEGLMKLRIEKVLGVTPGGTLTATQGAGAPPAGTAALGPANANNSPLAGPATGNSGTPAAAAAAVNKPLSQMTPDERVKAAKEKLKAAQKAETTYQQAIQNHVGGVPQGVSPTTYNQLQRNQNAPPNVANNGQNWQPFATDAVKNNKNGATSPTQNPYSNYQNQAYQQQMYQNFLNNSYANPYGQTYVPLQNNQNNR